MSWRVVATAVVGLTALATLGSAQARPSGEQARRTVAGADTADQHATARALADASTRFGIPVLKPNPYAEPYDGTGRASAQAPKLKTTIAVPDARFLSYLRLCVQVADQGTFDPANCPEFHPPRTTFDATDSLPIWLNATGPIWVSSPAGSALRYGSFAPVRVRTLAFGSIPISAIVHITQPVGRDGFVRPLQLSYMSNSNTSPDAGGTVLGNSRYPRVVIPANSSSYVVERLAVTGPVDIRVSDVAVDGRPVAVGSQCRTSTPGTLRLGSPAGYYRFDAPASSLRGRPGGAQVLNIDDGGSAQGTVSIPPFAGCGVGREDLDPLLTSLVSGPNNPLDVAFTAAFNACSRDDRARPCPKYPVGKAAQQVSAKARALSSAVAGASSSRWQRLDPASRARIVQTIARMPAGQRALVVVALPRQAQAQVVEAIR